ncbi:hypothetical protein VNO78_24817 [Psophocarpus tetragonolobus]|uniref:Reverse transcriptase zinc-binding domain-containing protein n=1 Tax=Psophocarpus tetragonolobus TaxID=3891 RepID=A0AAN9XEJ8_PSOTE
MEGFEDLYVTDLMNIDSGTWNIPLIEGFIVEDDVNAIIRTPLLISMVLDTSHLKMKGNWNILWQLNIPPRLCTFFWILCRGCLPIRLNLQACGCDIVHPC